MTDHSNREPHAPTIGMGVDFNDEAAMQDAMLQEVARVYALLALHESWLEKLFIAHFEVGADPHAAVARFFADDPKMPYWASELDAIPGPMAQYLKQHLTMAQDNFAKKVTDGLTPSQRH